jgi:F-type H+-transporting ATPase subunit a
MNTFFPDHFFSAISHAAESENAGGAHFDPQHHVMDSPDWHLNGPWGEFHVPLKFFQGTIFETSLTTMTLCLVVLILMFLVLKVAADRKQNPDAPPRGLANALEGLVVFIRDEIVYPNCGHKAGRKLLPFFLTLFCFILTANFLGMIPFSFTVTNQYPVTFTLAILSGLIIFFGGFVTQGPKFALTAIPVKLEMNLLLPIMAFAWILIFSLEIIIGPIIKTFALMVRLKANMTAGHLVILSLLFLPFQNHGYGWGVIGVLLSLIIMLLEVLVCVLQAYVFTLLSAIFIGHSVNTEHEH